MVTMDAQVSLAAPAPKYPVRNGSDSSDPISIASSVYGTKPYLLGNSTLI